MKINSLRLISVCFIALYFLSFDWPANDSIINSSFGESRYDHFHSAIDLLSKSDIFATKNGRILYEWKKRFHVHDNYPGTGNALVLQHANGIRSYYYHIEDDAPFYFRTKINKRQKIGEIGNTGHTYGKHLHFAFGDMNTDQLVNPLLLLKKMPDKIAPVFQKSKGGDGVYIIHQGKLFILKKKHETALGYLKLVADIVDPVSYHKLGIYKLELFVNNKLKKSLVFNKITKHKNHTSVSNHTFNEIYYRGKYYALGEVAISGKTKVEIVAYDFAGNKTRKVFLITKK